MANLAAYLVSDFSAYVNGEVVTIDGGEWLQGAGEFNMLRTDSSRNVGYARNDDKKQRKSLKKIRPKIFSDF